MSHNPKPLSFYLKNAYTTNLTDGTLSQTRAYNSFGELTQLRDNTLTYSLTQRDNSGAITQKIETLDGATTTYDYTFDNRGRLTQVQKDNTIVEEYTYDNNGNRQSATVDGTTITASYTLDDNLVTYGNNTYLYDEDGYLAQKTTPDGTTTYSYGTMGELLSVTTPTNTITYKHNASNQRVAKLVDGVVTEKYLWANLTTLLAVYDVNDTLVQRFEYADSRMPISMTMGAMKYYLHYDQVGTLRAVTDINHNILKEVVYDTFGNVLSDTNQTLKLPFGFAGGLYDSDTKLTRFGYRDYDAYAGKWTAKDPIGFAGGDSNLYGYVLGDPVNFVDPTGENWIVIGSIIIYLGYQFNGWVTNRATPAQNAVDKYPDLQKRCDSAMLCSNSNARSICAQAYQARIGALNMIGNATSSGAFLPGTLGGGPLPTSIPGVISGEVQGKLREIK